MSFLFLSGTHENFESQAAFLDKFIPYIIIKDLLYDLLEDIPQVYRDRYDMDRPPTDPKDMWEIDGDE